MSRIGVFGGSFDPVHVGHLVLADQCREQLNLDEVRFVPAYVSPLKQHAAPISSEHRVAMLRLAIQGNCNFSVDTRELEREGVSYTVDTLLSMREEFPEAELFLLMGADSVQDLPKWKSPERILELAAIGAITRGGVGEPDWTIVEQFVGPERLLQVRQRIDTPSLEISSSDLRQRIADGRSVRYLLPELVERYVNEHDLYRS